MSIATSASRKSSGSAEIAEYSSSDSIRDSGRSADGSCHQVEVVGQRRRLRRRPAVRRWLKNVLRSTRSR